MDAFYASVEQRDFPQYRNKPVVVGGSPESRGVVCTASYEARKFGVHSAMSCSKAHRLCPEAIFLQPRMNVYKSISSQIREIFAKCTDVIEPLSLDEAYLDVTQNKFNCPSATIIAEYIQKEIFYRTKLTASAGVSYNKFLAKTASDIRKPAGITVITPEEGADFVKKMAIKNFFGIGKQTAKKMHSLNIKYGSDLLKFSKYDLLEMFGKYGIFLYDIVRGIDYREINPTRRRKSFGREITLHNDINNYIEIIDTLFLIANEVTEAMQQIDIKGRTVSIKIKFNDFSTITRSLSDTIFFNDLDITKEKIKNLLDKINMPANKTIRLLGVTFSNLEDKEEDNKSLPSFLYQPELPLPF